MRAALIDRSAEMINAGFDGDAGGVMTACLYASPWIDPGRHELGCVPLVLADTLVTWRGVPAEAEITPATVTVSSGGKVSSVTLARKVHIIGHAAIAMAGDGALIRQAREDFRYRIDEWAKGERPMRTFGDYLNTFGLNRIQAVGSYAFQDSNRNNTLMAFEPFHLPQFGICGVVGSGHEDMSAAINRIDRDMNRDADVFNKIRQLGHAINGARMVNEMVGSAKNAWGGYIEYALLCPDRVWRYGPKSLDLFYMILPLDERKATVGMLPRWIAYDPGDAFGRVLSLLAEDDGPASFAEFRLHDEPAGRATLEHWVDWKPDSFAITFVRQEEGGRTNHATLPCRIEDRHRVSISVSPERLEVRVEDDYVDYLARLLLPKWGLEYVPLREIQQAIVAQWS